MGPERSSEERPTNRRSEATLTDKITSDESLPEDLAGYEILEELGRGAMGIVYKAKQKGLDRIVAIKMILHAEYANQTDQQRFYREAQAIARLDHPNVVQIHEIGEHQGNPFFSLEFVEGGTLDDKLRGTPLEPNEAASIVETMARAIHVAHNAEVLHRDLKPANVLLTNEGQPKITDFGLAKRLDDDSQSSSGSILGTPSYMSPEQAQGLTCELDSRSDVYSLGAVFYECLTGRPPFRAATVMDTLLQVIISPPVSPAQLQPTIPRDLETICLKCLEKDPSQRYFSALEVAEDLQRYQNGIPIVARPISTPQRVLRWCNRNRLATGLIGSMLLLVLTLIIAIPWIGLERAKREQQETLAKTEKQRNIHERRGRANERFAIATKQLQDNDLRAAVENYSEAIGITRDIPELLNEHQLATEKRAGLLTCEKFLKQESEIAARLDSTDPAMVRGPFHNIDQVRLEQRAKIEETLNLFDVLGDENWRKKIDQLDLSADHKQLIRDKILSLTYLLAFGYSFSGDKDKPKSAQRGLLALDRIVELEGHSHTEWMLRMWFYQRLGKTEEANHARKQMEATHLASLRDYYWQGLLLLEMNRPNNAINYFLEALKRNPAHYSSHFSLYECYKRVKDYQGQLRELTACLALTPKDGQLFLMRGLTYFFSAQGNPHSLAMAFQDFDAAIVRDPKLADAWYYRGRMLITSNQWVRAERDLSEALKLNPTLLGGHYWRAFCRAKAGQHEKAVLDAEEAVKLQPKGASTHFYAARAYAICVGILKDSDPASKKQYTDRCLELLKKAITLGYRRLEYIGPGTDFDSVRDDPRFPKSS